MIPIRGISEIVLVVQDVGRAERFYREVLGLPVETRIGDEWCWVRVAEGQFIGLARPGKLKFGAEHCEGPIHFAFDVDPEDLDAARHALEEKGVAVEGPVEHAKGRSVYFSDPDGNRLELIASTGSVRHR